jgi:excisionase family DNA binding protein
MDSSERWYSVKEFAMSLSVGVDSVRRWIKEKKLRAFKMPKLTSQRHRVYDSYRIAESERQRFIRRQMNF